MLLTPPNIIIVVQLNGFISGSLLQQCPLYEPPTFHLDRIQYCGDTHAVTYMQCLAVLCKNWRLFCYVFWAHRQVLIHWTSLMSASLAFVSCSQKRPASSPLKKPAKVYTPISANTCTYSFHDINVVLSWMLCSYHGSLSHISVFMYFFRSPNSLRKVRCWWHFYCITFYCTLAVMLCLSLVTQDSPSIFSFLPHSFHLFFFPFPLPPSFLLLLLLLLSFTIFLLLLLSSPQKRSLRRSQVKRKTRWMSAPHLQNQVEVHTLPTSLLAGHVEWPLMVLFPVLY